MYDKKLLLASLRASRQQCAGWSKVRATDLGPVDAVLSGADGAKGEPGSMGPAGARGKPSCSVLLPDFQQHACMLRSACTPACAALRPDSMACAANPCLTRSSCLLASLWASSVPIGQSARN